MRVNVWRYIAAARQFTFWYNVIVSFRTFELNQIVLLDKQVFSVP